MAGALPALLVFLIRLFVPESHKWEAQQAAGATSHWATRDLVGVGFGALGAMAVITVWSPFFNVLLNHALNGDGASSAASLARIIRLTVTIVGLLIAMVGYIYPVLRYLGRAESANQLQRGEQGRLVRRMLLGACLAGVPLLGTWGALQWAPKWAISLASELPAEAGPYLAKENTQIATSAGAIIGTIIAALMAGWLGRRLVYTLLCLGSFASLVFLYQACDAYGAKLLVSVFVAGGVTAAFYGWFPLYFPELFPTSIRATAQGFAFNFGRVLSALGSLQTATLTAYFAKGISVDRIEIEAFPKAGAALASIYLFGILIIWLAPETKSRPLPN